MAYESVSDISSEEEIKTGKINTIHDNIQDLRDRLVDASSYNWSEMPVSSDDPVENEDINELQDALDGAEDANTCEECSDLTDRTDDSYDSADSDYNHCPDNSDDLVNSDDGVNSNDNDLSDDTYCGHCSENSHESVDSV